MYELPDGAVQMYLRDPADNLIEIDWPDARTLAPDIREDLIQLSASVGQTGDALSATLFLDRRDVTTEPSTAGLLRHFGDLRDGTHGGARSRRDKERLFDAAVPLLDPYARQVLDEINTSLMLGAGEVTATGVRSSADGTDAVWALSWPEQRAAGIKPIIIRAYFGAGFAHPHLQSGTVGDWPLNVFDEEQAAAELPTLRAMAAADTHNLVFQVGGDVRIVPATVEGP
jgi:hypothetical protein